VIKTFVAHEDRALGELVVKASAAPLAPRPPDFENVGEVGANRDAEGNLQNRKTVIEHLQLFIRYALPQEPRAHDVQRAARDRYLLIFRYIDVRKVSGEGEIVGFNIRTQQQRTSVPRSRSPKII